MFVPVPAMQPVASIPRMDARAPGSSADQAGDDRPGRSGAGAGLREALALQLGLRMVAAERGGSSVWRAGSSEASPPALRYGPEAEILGPPEIRELVREVAEAIAAAYGCGG